MTLREETAREREEKDKQQAEVAFSDYFHLGPSRSIKALFEMYVAKAREEGATSVPTRHRPKLTQWRKQYNWDERCTELENKDIDSKYRDYETIRRIRSDQLLDLSANAIKVYEYLLDPKNLEVKDNIRYQAAEAVLDCIGVTRKFRQTESQKKPTPTTPDLPDADADPSTLEAYWANRNR